MKTTTTQFTLLLLLLVFPSSAIADDAYNDSLKAFLHQNFDQKNAGMVVGIVDAQGSNTFSAGRLDNGTEQEVDGNTVFEIGSVTKTFTSLLLLEMGERGEMKLNDSVAKYLPEAVKIPTRNGREITLFNLAAQDSGLPFNADNHRGADWAERFASYTVPNMYEFLGSCQLIQDPGEKFQYSNIGMGLLGHVMALRAGQDFESLVIDRICRPLRMESTCITLTPELKSRFAVGHDAAWKRAANLELPAIAGAGALRSTAHDLLKYAAAHLGLIDSPLTPLMKTTHVIRYYDARVRDQFEGRTAMPWFDEGVYQPPGSDLLGHSGGTEGYNSFVGFDLKQRRGVVVLTNQSAIHSSMLGWRVLQRARLNELDATTMAPVREIVGLGVSLDLDQKSSTVRITKIIPDSPASQAGLESGLVISSINDVSVTGKSPAECISLMRGAAGTTVRLEVTDRRGSTSTIALTKKKFLIES